MKTIQFTLGVAHKAGIVICMNKDLDDIKQDTIATYLIPPCNNPDEQLELINELEISLWMEGIGRSQYKIE